MKTEKEIEKLFRKYKNVLILKLGKIPLTTDMIDKECRNLFGIKFVGAFAYDENFPIKNNKYYIINTDSKNSSGEHWISIITKPTRVYVYDSFARNPKKLIPLLTKKFKNKKIIFDLKDAEQIPIVNGKQTIVCGHNCIAFLRIAHELGIRSAMKI